MEKKDAKKEKPNPLTMNFFQRLFSKKKEEGQEKNEEEEKNEENKISYPMLPPRRTLSVEPEDYIMERFNGSIKWYDREAGKAKKAYMRLRLVSVVGGALVPVLINVDIPYMTATTTVISLLVLLAVSIDSVYHYGEQWSSYRSTEQFLRREYYLYTVNEGPYRHLNDRQQ